MSTREIAQEFTQLCKDGRFDEAGRKFWSDDVVSLEDMPGPMARMAGRQQVEAKGEWWNANHEVHSMRTEGPFVHGDQFSVIFDVDVTPKTGERQGQRMAMREVGVYTVKGGKIVEERFFY
jgi:ketosteroid isomerase-like protein